MEIKGVSQNQGCFLGRMGLSKLDPVEARQNSFLAFREHVMEQSSECAGLRLLFLLSLLADCKVNGSLPFAGLRCEFFWEYECLF